MVYVDRFVDATVPPKWRGGGHLIGTDIEELHAFAKRIGLRRGWFQNKSIPHYDVTKTYREHAIRAGATPIPWGRLPDDILFRRKDGTYETRLERRERLAARGVRRVP